MFPFSIIQLQLGIDFLLYFKRYCTRQAAMLAQWNNPIVKEKNIISAGFHCWWKDQSWSGSGTTVCNRNSTTSATWPLRVDGKILINKNNKSMKRLVRRILCYKLHYALYSETFLPHTEKEKSSLLPSAWSNHSNDSIRHIYKTYTTDDQTKRSIGLYWAIQRSWFARVNALCNLARKKSREVAAHFRADFWVGVASRCV